MRDQPREAHRRCPGSAAQPFCHDNVGHGYTIDSVHVLDRSQYLKSRLFVETSRMHVLTQHAEVDPLEPSLAQRPFDGKGQQAPAQPLAAMIAMNTHAQGGPVARARLLV